MAQVASILVAVILLTAAGGLGVGLLRLWGLGVKRGEGGFSGLALGLGTLSLILFCGALMGGLYAVVAWGLMAFVVVVFAKSAAWFWSDVYGTLRRFLGARGGFNRLLVLVVAAALALDFVSSLAPPTETDAMTLHLPFARAYAESHRMVFEGEHWESCMAMGPHLLYAAALLTSGGDVAPGVLHFLTGCAFLLWTWQFARKRFGRDAAYPAMAVLAVMPMITHLIMAPMIDMFLALYALAALVWLLDFLKKWAPSSLVVAGVLAAFSATVKYSGIVTIASVLVVGAAAALLRRKARGRLVAGVAAAAVAAALTASPFFLRNYVWTGNPVFPSMKGVFGGPGWDAPRWSRPDYGDERYELLHHSIKNMALAPWRVTMYARGVAGGESELVGPAFVVFLPVVFFMRSRRRLLVQLAAYCLVAFVLIYWTSPRPRSRYFLSIMPITAAYVGAGLLFLRKYSRGAFWTGRLVVLFAAASGFSVTAVYSVSFAKAVFGLATRDAFLTRSTDFYGEYRWMDAELAKDATVLVQATNDLYYCPRRAMQLGVTSDYTHMDNQAFFALDGSSDAKAAYERLGALGVTHIFAGKRFVNESNTSPAGQILARMEREGLIEKIRQAKGTRGTRNPFGGQRAEDVATYQVVYDGGHEP